MQFLDYSNFCEAVER